MRWYQCTDCIRQIQYVLQHVCILFVRCVLYSVLISTPMPYPYQYITTTYVLLDDLPRDVHYDAKPALSIPSKLSVPRIRRYWFVLVRTDTYLTVSYHIIPYRTEYIQLPWPHPTSAILISDSIESVKPLSFFHSPLGALSLLPTLPPFYYLIVSGPWKGWCTVSSISVFKLISRFSSFFIFSSVPTEYTYELMRATNWLE